MHVYTCTCYAVQQVWFADDATAGGKLHQLHTWWCKLHNIGPTFGYYANPNKTWLIVKDKYLPIAKELFSDTGVNITTEGKRHLGAALGAEPFVSTYVQNKVEKWTTQIKHLSQIAKTQPHAAYSAFTHGLSSKWTYLLRTIPNIAASYSHLSKPSDATLFLPSQEESPYNLSQVKFYLAPQPQLKMKLALTSVLKASGATGIF